MDECASNIAAPAPCIPRPLIIVDLNGVLLLSTHKPHLYPRIKPDGAARSKKVYFRPHSHDFLRYLFATYRVAVWTSNIKANADAIVALLFTPEQREQLLFVWAREQCVEGPNYTSFKHLSRIFEQYNDYNMNNVLIVDDSADKIVGPPQCHYHIKSWQPLLKQDDELLSLVSCLNTKKWSETRTPVALQ